MAGLFDIINKQLQSPGATTPPALGETQEASRLFQAKSGKAATPSATPAQSSIGEQVAQQTAKSGLEQIGQQAQIGQMGQREQAADIQQAQQIDKSQSSQKSQQLQQMFNQQSQSILDDLQASSSTLDANSRMAKMEQAGFMIRHQNDKYINELQRQGKMQRLDNNLDFRTALAQDIFKDNEDLLSDDVKFRGMLDATGRQYTEALASMSDDFALKMADKAADQENAEMKYSAGSKILSSGLEYAKDSNTAESASTQNTPTNYTFNNITYATPENTPASRREALA